MTVRTGYAPTSAVRDAAPDLHRREVNRVAQGHYRAGRLAGLREAWKLLNDRAPATNETLCKLENRIAELEKEEA